MSYNKLPPADPTRSEAGPPILETSLYERAVQDQSSLTDAERRQILGRLPQDEEDALCQQQTGLVYEEILEKALSDADSLTYQESRIVSRGVEARALQAFDRVAATRALPPDQRQLVEAARTAATTDRERRAKEAALKTFTSHQMAIAAAGNALSGDDRRNLNKSIRVPWLEYVLSLDASHVWGFAMMRCDFSDEALWEKYRNALDGSVRNSLAFKANEGRTEAAVAKFAMLYADESLGTEQEDRASIAGLRQNFVELKSTPRWTQGLREDVFLYADTAALASLETERPFCWAAEADQDPDDQTETAAQGLKVALSQVAPTLFARLLQKQLGPTQDEPRTPWRPYHGPPTLQNLRSQAVRAENEIWPPSHHWN